MERRTRSYLQLIKPGITFSNTLTGMAGFFLAASQVPFQLGAFFGALLGIGGVIASACVVNNIIDRDIDKRMKRTAKRELASGHFPIKRAVFLAVMLGLVGFGALLFWTNLVTLGLGALAFVWYVVIYGVAKRKTALSTLIGAVPGALPPVAGYTALVGHIDIAAIILFLMLFFWQLPHFYAIAMFRKDDYAKAHLPVWSVRYGLKSTKQLVMVSAFFYALSASLLSLFGYTGIIYFAGMTGLSLYWLYVGLRHYSDYDDIKWAKAMFGVSLLVILALSGFVAIGGFVV